MKKRSCVEGIDEVERASTWRAAAASAVAAVCIVAGACAPGLPKVAGLPSASPSPQEPWVAPSRAKAAAASAPAALSPAPPPTLPAELVRDSGKLSLPQVVELALQNSPATRASWLLSRSAAATYGEQRGTLLPSLSLGASATTSQQVASSVRFGGRRNQVSPTVGLSYLVFDVGGRSGARDAAEEGLFAAGFNHDAVIQNTVLLAEQAYFGYMANRALLAAQQASVAEARADMEAAQNRHDVGLATIADVLQARTALSQAQLAVESTQGTLQAARASLAVTMGLPANTSFDVAPPPDSTPVGTVSESVDSLIAQAVRNRPDLEASESRARQADASARIARSRLFPAVSLTGNGGRVYSDVSQFSGESYTFSLSLNLPVFTGGANRYAAEAADASEQASAAQARSLRDQVIQQVFTSYYALQTAARRVGTSDDLLASATQSEEVARGRYTEGVGTIIDLLTAQGALANARAQQSQARWSWLVSLAQLAHDVGVLGTNGASPIPLSTDSTDAPAPPQP